MGFAFETVGIDTGAECEGTPDLMAMINGGEHSLSATATIELDETSEDIDDANSTDEDYDNDEVDDDTDVEDESDSLEFVKAQFMNCALLRQRIEDELKETKAEEKALLKKLQRLTNQSDEKPSEQPKPQAVASTDQPDLPFDIPASDPDWWNIPASKVLEEVAGIGDKKRDSLLAVVSTLKDLEDLRGEASRAFKHFSEVLPDGIGKALADQIEEAMLKAIS